MKKGFLAVLVCAALLSQAPGGNSTPDEEWELVFERGDLRVQRREYRGSELQEIQGTTRLRASLAATMALLRDAPYNHHWVYRSGGARILQQTGYSQAYVYGIVDAPWPMHDRDTVVRFDYTQDPQTGIITIGITNFPDFIPPEGSLVRVPDFGGFWRLQPEGDGWIAVTYQVYGDPGGSIPVWIANYAAALSVTRTLQNMTWAVQRYADMTSAEVAEPNE